MKTRSSDIADFYQQLALLVKSDLPLPDSLRQLGRYFPRRDFQAAVLEVSERIARGATFSEAIRSYPQFFHPFHVQLITAGEASGTLPEILFAVARFARFGQLLTARVRDVLAYPLLTVHLCLIVFFFLCVFVISQFGEIYRDLLDGMALPAITAFVTGVGTWVAVHWWPICPCYAVFLVFTLWIFCPGIAAHRTMLAVVNRLPGSCHIVSSLDAARLCGMWSTFLAQEMTAPDAMRAASQLVERKALRCALVRAADTVTAGGDLVEALSREKAVDPLITLTFRHAPEQELAQELRKLGELFEHRVTLAARSATITWTIMALVVTTLSVAFVVLALFVPLISILGMLGG